MILSLIIVDVILFEHGPMNIIVLAIVRSIFLVQPFCILLMFLIILLEEKVVLRNDKVVLRNDKVVLRTDKVVHWILLFLSILHSPLSRRHGQRKFQFFSK